MLRFCSGVSLSLVLCSVLLASPPVIKTVTITPSDDAEIHTLSSSVYTTGGTLTAGEGDYIIFKFPLNDRPNTGDIISSKLVLTASTQSQDGFYFSNIVACGRNWSESDSFATIWGSVTASSAGYPIEVAGGNKPTYEVESYNGCYAIYVDGTGIVVGRSQNNATSSNWPKWVITYSDEDAGPGDANADGAFTPSDLVLIFAAGKYELDVNATWEEGDWNGDNRFDTSDLILAFAAGTYTAGDPAVAWAELNQ